MRDPSHSLRTSFGFSILDFGLREKRGAGTIFRVYQSAGNYRTIATVVNMFGNDTSQVIHAEAR